jgi:hypothetical protein
MLAMGIKEARTVTRISIAFSTFRCSYLLIPDSGSLGIEDLK